MNIFDFQKMKKNQKKISMITCYDYWSAKIIAQTNIDCVLVGDSLAMVIHGHPTTITASVELMRIHTEAVARGINGKFIIADMPFLSYRKSLSKNMKAVETLMQAGAHAIKLEGADGNLEFINHVVTSGVPVIGHLGMTMQSFHQLGGTRVQGKDEQAAGKILADAVRLENAGCFAVVLECVPNALAKKITEALKIPIIGIGAGPDVDGQVLVLQDLLGVFTEFKPKFVRHYLNGAELIQHALNRYDTDVKQKIFPASEHCYE